MTMTTTLLRDINRCSGRTSSGPKGKDCAQRDTCQRYLAFEQWDRAAGIESYRGISVVLATENCEHKIEHIPDADLVKLPGEVK